VASQYYMSEAKLTKNMLKWMDAEFRKQYHKDYYRMKKERQAKVMCKCTLCNREVTLARLGKHQTTHLYIDNRVDKE
jgi:hypothetical protein